MSAQFERAYLNSPAEAVSNDHLQKMYDRISGLAKIGVWEFDLATEKLVWTDTVYDIFEIPRNTVLQRGDILKHYDPSSLQEMEDLRAEAIRTGSGFAIDILIRTTTGVDRWIRMTADIEQEDGKSVRIFGTKQDITSEREAQQKVQSLQNQLGYAARASAMQVMASTLAHKVSQPLTAATNYISAILAIADREPLSEKLAHGLKEALHSMMIAGEIIREMRAMARKSSTSPATFELHHVVQEALSMVDKVHPDVSVICNLGPPATILGDFFQIQQVLINLISNAREATASGTCRITIDTLTSEKNIEICVSDNGPGIAKDVLPNIFGAFVTTKPAGLGIGLSIAQTIIEAHGGHIKASNLSAGGASVSFTIPRV